MGILRDAQFADTSIVLAQGDILTLFTDGVTEQENETGEEFSMSRLEKVVLNNESESASALVAHISQAVSTFAGTKQQADDLTVVVMKIL
jgi:serine phosphatase RsbU (regulator of sigma subunit)